MKRKLLLLGIVAGLVLIVAACAPAAAPTQAPAAAQPACPTAAPCPAAAAAAPAVETPFEALWAASGHAKTDSEAFRHWDKSDPAQVPTNCAKCHSSAGLAEFLAKGKVETAVPAADNKNITCTACHNDASLGYTAVTFPSGVVVSGLGREAICMTCHQGRESKVSVDALIEKFKVTDLDAVVAPMKDDAGKDVKFGFLNVHYAAAGATLYGSEVHGGYEYEGKSYDYRFGHIDGYTTCVECHNSHSTQLKVEKCAMCHEGVKTADDTQNIRMISSSGDYNGNGNVTEGMAAEIKGLQDLLQAQIQKYAKEKAGVGIVYDPATYPYFLTDADGDGKADQKDGASVPYTTWTARLLKAAYNLQFTVKDAGGFAHNGKYMVELLHDSIEDLGGDVSKLAREDAGHFAGDAMAFRDWDSTGVVPFNCAKCHSATGLPAFIKAGGTVAVLSNGSTYQAGVGDTPVSDGFTCYTCHDDANWPKNYQVASVPFPNGKSFSLAQDADGKNVADNSNLCLECHQGRQSGKTVSLAVAGKDPDKADPAVRFQNVHYLSAGATLFGTAAGGMYEYPNQKYAGQNKHVEGFATCVNCHDAHALTVKTDKCKGCHGSEDVGTYRKPGDVIDYDGDGDTKEGYEGEVATMREKLYAALQNYATTKLKAGIIYDPAAYPYFYADVNGDGKPDVDKDNKNVPIQWSPREFEGAYNLNYATKEPGGFAHNPFYVMQVLYDAIKDLGGDVKGMTRPQ